MFLLKVFLVEVFSLEVFLRESPINCFSRKHHKWFFNEYRIFLQKHFLG